MHYAVWRAPTARCCATPTSTRSNPSDWAGTVYPDLVRDGRTILVAESDNEPVGVLIFRSDVLDPQNLEIEALYIAADRQKEGIGARLMEEAYNRRPSPRVVVACAKENWSARDFYHKKLGFQRDSGQGRDRFWEPEWLPGVKVPLVWYVLDR